MGGILGQSLMRVHHRRGLGLASQGLRQIDCTCDRAPTTGSLSSGRAGAGNRTPDPLLTMEVLCRLSYSGYMQRR